MGAVFSDQNITQQEIWRRKYDAELERNKRNINHIKLLVVGNNAVGKTSLINNFLYGYHREEYEPTMLEDGHYKGDMMINLGNSKNEERTKLSVEIVDVNGEIDNATLFKQRQW